LHFYFFFLLFWFLYQFYLFFYIFVLSHKLSKQWLFRLPTKEFLSLCAPFTVELKTLKSTSVLFQWNMKWMRMNCHKYGWKQYLSQSHRIFQCPNRAVTFIVKFRIIHGLLRAGYPTKLLVWIVSVINFWLRYYEKRYGWK